MTATTAALPRDLADAIYLARLRRDWSLRTAAELLGISHTYLATLEEQGGLPSYALAKRLCRVYELDDETTAKLMAAVDVPRPRRDR